MKKIIEGRQYNTETARLLGKGYSKYPRNDFNFWQEALYLTKSGAYFIHGEGGPASRYSVSSGNNSWSGGEKILPLSPSDARDWAEELLDAEEYAKIFGEPDEASDEREVLNVSISANLKFKIDREREETGKTLSQIVEEILAEKFK